MHKDNSEHHCNVENDEQTDDKDKKEYIPFLETAENAGIEPAIIEITAQLMREHTPCDHSEEAAKVLCILLGKLLSGQATVTGTQLNTSIDSWCHMYTKENAQALRDWLKDDNEKDNSVNYIKHAYKNKPLERCAICCYKIDDNYENNIYTLPRFAEMQQDLDTMLTEWTENNHISESETEAFDAFIKDITDEHNPYAVNLDDRQKEAILCFVKNRLTVVAGGPGTGKTSNVICQILRYVLSQELYQPSGPALKNYAPEEILLCAPTGKAAQRMAEAIGNAFRNDSRMLDTVKKIIPQTLHRMLGIRLGSESTNDLSTARLIIVDEVSMVDLNLAKCLFRALQNNHMVKIVLVGDPNQLPPVNAGDILSHLQDKAENAYIRLTKNYRTDCNEIAHAQNAVISGNLIRKLNDTNDSILIDDIDTTQEFEKHDLTVTPTAFNHAFEFDKFKYIKDISNKMKILDKWCKKIKSEWEIESSTDFKETVREISNFNDIDEGSKDILRRFYKCIDSKFRVLTAVHQGMYGAAKINDIICSKLELGKSPFPPGALVMITQNNYQIDHFNGETGIVIKMSPGSVKYPGMTCAAIPNAQNDFDIYPVSSLLGQLSLAFAITIHKSQGSEYTHGLILLPAKKSILMSRNLLYTAISRTRKSATLVAGPEVLYACLEHDVSHDKWITDIIQNVPA